MSKIVLVITLYYAEGLRPLDGEQRKIWEDTLHQLITYAMRQDFLHRISIEVPEQGYLSLLKPPEE